MVVTHGIIIICNSERAKTQWRLPTSNLSQEEQQIRCAKLQSAILAADQKKGASPGEGTNNEHATRL